MKAKYFLILAAGFAPAVLIAQSSGGDTVLLQGRLEKQLAEITALDAEIQSLSQLLGREGTPLPRREPAKPAPPPEVVPQIPPVVAPAAQVIPPVVQPAPVTPGKTDPQVRPAIPVDEGTPPRPATPPTVVAQNPQPVEPSPPPLPPPPIPVPQTPAVAVEPVAPPKLVTPPAEIPLPPVELPQPGPPTLADQPDPVLPPPVPRTAVNGNEYTVQAGDSFSSIARKTKFSVSALQKANPNVVPEKLQLGQKLHLPSDSAPVASITQRSTPQPEPAERGTRPDEEPATQEKVHVVQAGDTLHAIAQRSGTTVEAISKLNGITNPAALQLGTKLKLPNGSKVVPATAPATAGGDPTPSKTPRPTPPGSHVVKPGETLYSISRQTGTPIEELRKVNGLKDDTIHPGQSLKVRRGSQAPASPRPETSSTTTVQAPAVVAVSAPAGKPSGVTASTMATAKPLPVKATPKAPSKPLPAQGVQMTEYTVAQGESLFTIARKHFLSREELATMNSLPVDLPLQAGQKIRLPAEAVSSREMAENESTLR